MKPHTTIERQIVALSESLVPLPLTPEMFSWAEKSIFLKWGVLSRGKFHCLDYRHAWKPESKKQSAKFTKCTACKEKLKMHVCNQIHFKEIEYSAVVTCLLDKPKRRSPHHVNQHQCFFARLRCMAVLFAT